MAAKKRPSAKTWKEIEERYLGGESARKLGAEYGVPESSIRSKFAQSAQAKAVAKQIVDAEVAFRSLTPAAQVTAQTMVEQLREISYHIGGAATYGAKTAHRLHGIANSHANTIDDVNPDMEVLQTVARLAAVANEAAKPALNLLAANRDAAKASESDVDLIAELNKARDRVKAGRRKPALSAVA